MQSIDDNIQQSIKKGVRSVANLLYDEIYIYVWFVCIYHVLLVIIVLTNLVLLFKMYSYRPSHSSLEFATLAGQNTVDILRETLLELSAKTQVDSMT